MAKLSANAKRAIHDLLTRLSELPVGKTVVANVDRALCAAPCEPHLVERILLVWAERVTTHIKQKQREFHNAGLKDIYDLATIPQSTLLGLTLGRLGCDFDLAFEALDALPKIDRRHAEHWTGCSHLKTYADLLDYLLAPPPFDPSTSNKAFYGVTIDVDIRKLSRQLTAAHTLSTASLHAKQWVWVTESERVPNPPTIPSGTPITDALGLIHFSKDFHAKSIEDKLVVELVLEADFVTATLKPFFAFADCNPRFVTWTDGHRQPSWGYAAHLEAFEQGHDIRPGLRERVAINPGPLHDGAIAAVRVHGFLRKDRWGPSPDEPKLTNKFAELMVEGVPFPLIVAGIMQILSAGI